jgi:hypothetical protein
MSRQRGKTQGLKESAVNDSARPSALGIDSLIHSLDIGHWKLVIGLKVRA